MRRDIFGTMKAKKAAVQHGHPSRGVELIAATGRHAATTTRLLAELLRESGKRVAVFTSRGSLIEAIPYTPDYSHSPSSIQRALSAARKQRCQVVIMEVVGALTRPQVMATLHIDMALVTDQSSASQALLEQSLSYVVLPHQLSTENLLVAPHQLINVGEDDGAEAQISDINLYRRGTELTLTIDHQTVIELATHLVGRSNAIATAFAAAAGYVLGVSVDVIPEGIARLENLPGNYQGVELDDAVYQLVVDSASQAEDIEELVASAKQLARRRLMVVVDTTVDSESVYGIKLQADRLIGVKGHSPVLTDEASSLEDAVALARRAAKKDDLVLLIGEDFAQMTADGGLTQEIIEASSGE